MLPVGARDALVEEADPLGLVRAEAGGEKGVHDDGDRGAALRGRGDGARWEEGVTHDVRGGVVSTSGQ